MRGLGTSAGRAVFTRRWRNPRRSRAGVNRRGCADRSQVRRRSSARGRARRSWVWTAMISHVHRSAVCGSRTLGTVQPRVCFGSVVGRPQPDRVQHGRPGRASRLQGGDEGVGPAGDELIRAAAPPVDVAEQRLRAGGGVGAQPVAHVDGEDDPPVGGARQRRGGQQPAQTARFQPAVIDPSYIAPCPRRSSAVSVNSTSDVTGPSEHSTASVSSKNASDQV